MSLPVWVEVHVDDEVLGAHPERAAEAARLVERIAQVARSRKARLCFRFRETFARLVPDSLPELVREGHEVGVHAHGFGLARATRAVRAAGVEPLVAVPGLVQAGPTGRAALLRQAASLGFRLVTDHGAERAWAYEGLLARDEHGVRVMAPTVRPFDWGVMARDGRRLGVTPEGVARLKALERQAARQGARWFGVALHEHDLCPPGSLQPTAEALDALSSYLGERVVPALKVAPEPPPELCGATPPSTHPVSDGRTRLARAVPRVRLPSLHVRRGPPVGTPVRIPVGHRHVVAVRYGPARPEAIVLASQAGPEGGRRLALTPFGLVWKDLAARGWALWLYDRWGTGDSGVRHGPLGRRLRPQASLAPGNPIHTEDWRAMLALARRERCPVVALTWSAGIVPVLRACVAGDRPDALVDGEGPADRWSLLPPPDARPTREAAELARRDPWLDSDWTSIEPVAMLPALAAPYARLQAEIDHVHGRMHEHARRMVAAACALPWAADLEILPGHLHRHPTRVLDRIAEVLRAHRR